MPNDLQFNPADQHLITNEAATKAYVHPMRMKIMGLLVLRAMTISQTAKEFGTHPANITHHFKLLEKAGLIKIVERRDIGRNVEKYYRAIARHFEVQNNEKISGANALALDILRRDLTEARSQLQSDDAESLLCLLWNAKIDKLQFHTFTKKLRQLMKEYQAVGSTSGEAYSLSLGLYPCQAEYGPTGKIEINRRHDKNTPRR